MGKVLQMVTNPADSSVVFYDPERDGITFSLLTGWKSCRELARLNLRGWTSRRTNLGFTFGGVIHELLQNVTNLTKTGQLTELPPAKLIHKELSKIEAEWKTENPFADADALQFMELTMLLAEPLLPLYFEHWQNDFRSKKWTHVEKEFKIPLTVHTRGGVRKTFVRGKMDGGFTEGKSPRPWLFETKTKTRVDEAVLVDILPFELQVNIYLWALKSLTGKWPKGVLYNVLRRPGLRQTKKETLPQFAQRILKDIHLRPDWYFLRMEMQTTVADMRRFELELMDLATDFLNWWYGHDGHYKNSNNCENKYGTCHYLPICSQQNYAPFYQRQTVFRELLEDL